MRITLPPVIGVLTSESAPTEAIQWGVEYLGAPQAWAEGVTGMGVVVAVVDTGVSHHICLEGRILPGYNRMGGIYPPDQTDDDHGHGTHVAGTIAAKPPADGMGVYGIAPDAQILPVKGFDGMGSGDSMQLAGGVRWAADQGAAVINCSWGSDQLENDTMAAVDYAVERGAVVCIAAGNSPAAWPGQDTLGYPARDPKGIAVAALDQALERAWFSSEGAELTCAAPGVNVLSLARLGGYTVLSGTSMATPHVSGFAALWVQAGKPGTFREWLLAHCIPLGAPTLVGAGMPTWLKKGQAAGLTRLELTVGSTSYVLDGEGQVSDVAPVIQNNRTLVPVRLVADALGAQVIWHPDGQRVSIVAVRGG